MTESSEKPSLYFKIFPYLIIAVLIFIQAVHGFYAIYDMSPSGPFVMVSYLLLFWLIGDWFMRDSKKNTIEWVHDMGFFLYISWPIFIPYYLFRTRGLKISICISLGFLTLYCGAYFLSYYLLYDIAP